MEALSSAYPRLRKLLTYLFLNVKQRLIAVVGSGIYSIAAVGLVDSKLDALVVADEFLSLSH